MVTEAIWPELLPIREGFPHVRVGTFWISKVAGNPYATKEMFRPVSVSDTVGYLERPDINKPAYGDRNTDLMQNVVYNSWELDRGRLAVDVPEGLYEWIRDETITPENIEERIQEIKERGAERYLPALQKYLTDVASLGMETAFSNNPFVVDLMSLNTEFHIQGEYDIYGEDLFRSAVRLAGGFNEVRRGEERDTIIRVRRNAGEPSYHDAINLAINSLAYQAESAANGQKKLDPRLLVFNLVEGSMRELGIFSRWNFYEEIGNAIFFSYLAKRAGFVPNYGLDGISQVDVDSAKSHEKIVEIKRGKKKKMILSASEAFHKGENCIQRLNGDLPNVYKKFDFDPIN